ncbi:MAG TPA: aminotransferase class V-fold PLP-dependent enzyme, partial [Anaerolineae bacterium]|nr:aminotransferase class V-fold PLP-dependent enzyme [Anaerolineae bacterium]
MIYLDNAASGWPKPPEALQAMAHYMEHASANPGRSGHRMALEAARIVYQARENVAALLGVRDPLRIVFAANATEALNLALAGLLRPGDHVITSSLEHNAVMRPLRALEARGVAVSVVHCSPEGLLDPRAVEAAIRPTTRLIALVHASNVVGTLLPIAEVGRIARRYDLLFLVDAAQTAGACPIDLDAAAIDLLAFTGHKALLGPQGTGGLYIGPRVSLDELRPLVHGGTGSRSEEELQPDFLPDRYESGTLNGVGLAGLAAGVQRLLEEGVATVR